MPQITRKITPGCEDKNCPAVWETDEAGLVAIQGTRMPASQRADATGIPGDEDIVFVPAAMLRDWASGQR